MGGRKCRSGANRLSFNFEIMAGSQRSQAISSYLADSPYDFLQPSLPLHTDVLAYLKGALDPLATDVSNTQTMRQKEARKKRKRGERDIGDEEVLRLKNVHTQGFAIEQIWEQARRVIDAARLEAERGLLEAQEPKNADRLADEEDVAVDEESSIGEEGVDWEYDGVDDGEDDKDGFESADEDLDPDGEIAQEALDDMDEVELDSEDLDDGDQVDKGPAEEFVADKHGLNDGFFSIDDFNKQSDFLEQQDARGDDDGAASDEEDINWEADPLTQAGVDGGMDDMSIDGDDAGGDGMNEDEEDGPTFGDPDAPSEDDEEVGEGELDGMGGITNTNNIMYAEFFAPPAQKKRKNKKGRPNPHNFPAAAPTIANGNVEDAEEPEEDIERTMSAVHRDLFEDDESEAEPDEEKDDLDPADPRSRRSTHERRRAALQEEIRKLEAANVAKREWTLSGEARAVDRPMNSLLEEDLDFERAGKPVPVITAEVSESIEELIKRRILAQDFQDIARRRPDDLATGKDGRRGRLDFELDDNKSKKGLAEMYEEEHLRNTDPNFVDVKDEKLAKEQKEIEALWKDVSAKLDSLSSWHFTPKAPAAQLDIRVDAPAISMEDARPAAGGEVAGASQLAPQEVYKVGQAAKDVKAEVVGKSGLPAGREELTREEKKRRRRREKERGKKAGGNEPVKPESKRGKEKKAVLGDLKKGGVRVIGKKGEMKDVEGQDVKNAAGRQGAAQFKL